ncbi:hypothetical protein [Bremerella sp.]|uniref:hypothetical protein n=1 Tax=Bremerella sp. TaxID=2795602 RepID=UPI00391B6F63
MSAARWTPTALLLVLLLTAGCGSGSDVSMGTVTGTVFVDGQPAPAGLQIEFDPTTKGVRGSTAVTNDSGQYEAEYSLSTKGVRLGTCVVKLVQPNVAPSAPGQKPKLPFPNEYYEEIRQVDISAGHNTVDLEISKKNR